MEELLNKLLASDLLTDETRAELAEAFKAHLDTVKAEARADAEVAVRAELIEKYHTDFDKLVEAVDSKAEGILRSELEELKEDIEKFRDLEVEYTEKLVEARHAMAEEVKADMVQLVETLDKFCEDRLAAEFTELHESIEDVKKNNLMTKLFEAFSNVYESNWHDESGVKAELEAAQTALAEAAASEAAAKKELTEMKRTAKMSQLLESLTGRPHEVMEAILKNAPTEALEETYNKFITRVLHETSKGNVSEKESAPAPVLAEEVTPTTVEPTVIVTGNSAEVVTESVKPVLSPAQERLRRLALD